MDEGENRSRDASDEASETNNDADQDSQSVNDDESNGDGDGDGDDEVKALRKALRKANRDAEQHRIKLKEFEDRDKTETQRLQESLQAKEREARDAQLNYLRLKVGNVQGLPPAIAERLRGETEDEMQDDAERLKELIGDNGASGSSADADQGRRGKGSSGDKTDMNSALRALVRGGN